MRPSAEFEPTKIVLPGGLTLLLLPLPGRRSVAAGAWLRLGSRHEPRKLMGVSHFLEHLLFKGTERRSARDIAHSLESLGGHLDAYTTREYVCYYARCLEEHLEEALDVLADLIGHATLSDEEVAREKAVVHEEIQSYEDNPEEKVNDLLGQALWGDDPLGWPILGTLETIDGLPAASIRKFYGEHYRSSSLVVSISGCFDSAVAADAVARHFDVAAGNGVVSASKPGAQAPRFAFEAKDTAQLQLQLGRPGLRREHEDRAALSVLNVLLGGGMSSRLFQSVREEAGLAYSVYSSHDAYRDTGVFGVSLGVRPDRGADALARVAAEMARFRREGPSPVELASGRAQLRGSLLLGQESVSQHMTHLAVDEIYHGRYVSVDERLERIARVSQDDVMRLADEFLVPETFTLAALGPEEGEAPVRGAWSLPA